MIQSKCWLVAETNLELESKVSHSIQTMKSKKFIMVLKCKKCFFLRNLTKISSLILCFLEITKIFIRVDLRQVTFYLRTEESCPSEAVSSLQLLI